jgi:hypothetical protein
MAESVRPPHKEGYAVNYATYMNHGCRCVGCTADATKRHREWRSRASKDVRTKINARGESRRSRQNAAMPTPNNGKPYSDQDKAIALNLDLTAREAAQALGRSMFSIKEYRKVARMKAAGGR